jgi:ABC-type Fe3+-hydroxamate transport system substrate-binding protein
MRLVSLCPSLTELLFDLGAGASVVGRTKFCVHPADEVSRVEAVGGTKNPRIARIIELAPDLVLMNEEENRVEDAEALRASGIAVHASMPRDAGETAAMVRSLGEAIGTHVRAEQIARDIEERARHLREAVAHRPPVRFAYLIWRRPWMLAGRDTYVDGLLSLAGGENVATSPERYAEVTPEALAAADPAVVFLSSEPFPFKPEHASELATLTGLPPSRFAPVDGELLSWHGSRTPRGIDYAGEVIQAVRDAGIAGG